MCYSISRNFKVLKQIANVKNENWWEKLKQCLRVGPRVGCGVGRSVGCRAPLGQCFGKSAARSASAAAKLSAPILAPQPPQGDCRFGDSPGSRSASPTGIVVGKSSKRDMNALSIRSFQRHTHGPVAVNKPRSAVAFFPPSDIRERKRCWGICCRRGLFSSEARRL